MKDLRARAQQRSVSAATAEFDELFESQCDYVCHTLRRLGVRPRDVEDVAQEVFVAVHLRFDSFDRNRSPRSWLFAFAFRAAANYRRLARHREQPSPGRLELAAQRGSPEESALEAEQRELLARALDTLDLGHRAAIVLCDIEQRSAPEAAELLGVPINTVYTRVHHARRKLREALSTLRSSGGGHDGKARRAG